MNINNTETFKSDVYELFYFKRAWAFGIPIVILAYLTYVFISFDILGLSERGSLQNAKSLVGDMYSHKVHVTRDNRKGDISISIEGEKKGRYPSGEAPEWIELGSTSKVDLGNGHLIYFGEKDVVYEVPDYGRIWVEPGLRGVQAEYPDGPLPEWINQSKNRVTITTDAGRLTITRNRTEVFRYFYGWELFFFTLDSQYHGKTISELASLAVNGELPKIMRDFWYNKMWRHSDVAWAIGETILMAFLGTFGAALVAFPLAFLAAKNITPLQPIRFFFRRIFDFTRGLDHLLWTIILARAFGPGPLTGALAMVVTDTGTFGKLFSEALENVDSKQIDGVKSTGARNIQRYRFGIIPQLTPVLLSQILYYFESNIRGATVIGAMVGGGIGLMLTQAIITQSNWEEVTYYIILIIFLVTATDWLSGKIRQRLIKGYLDS
ncbi:phosphonate ABC transporter, permease protein PhnE [Rhodobacterales bacterium FZCC0083]|nr:phosphonate ABC transporter, permease protein PhnE [Alphaproteobacteria bacterium]WRQ45993.1 phosphonate ABC transporter, permease protein PhnE [Rhodobacterales bacterium FZCC0083]